MTTSVYYERIAEKARHDTWRASDGLVHRCDSLDIQLACEPPGTPRTKHIVDRGRGPLTCLACLAYVEPLLPEDP